MGNSQSQSTANSNSSPTGSRRFGSPRPRTSVGAVNASSSPRRSSSLRSSNRPRSPTSSKPSRSATQRRGDGSSRGGIRVHHSLRTKKKSLELPDLAFTPVAATPTLAPIAQSTAIVIPASGRESFFPTESITTSASPTQIAEDTNSVSKDGTPPFTDSSFSTTVRSSIPFPINLQKIVAQQGQAPVLTAAVTKEKLRSGRINPRASEGEPTYWVKISWHGGGEEVFLMRAGDDDWNGRKKMENEVSSGEENTEVMTTFSTVVALPRGTHHLRFLVDGQQRVADDLPTSVDDNGALANYVAVGLSESDMSDPPTDLGDSTIIAGEIEADLVVETSETTPRAEDATRFEQVGGYPRNESHSSFWNENDDGDSPSLSSSPTSTGIVVPLTSIRGERGGTNRRTIDRIETKTNLTTGPNTKAVKSTYERKWTQEIPLELLEAAAEEENYLAYQNEVENAHASGNRVHITGFVPLPNIPPAPRLPRYLDKLILNNPVPAAGAPRSPGATPPINSNGGSTQNGNYAGIGAGSGLVGERTTRERERERHSPSREGRRREREWKSMSMAMAEGTATERDRGERDRAGRLLPVTTASGTDVTQAAQRRRSPPTSPLPTQPTASSSLQLSLLQPTQPLPYDIIPTIVDDTSVLPVPSHVVLHHLCTSSIKHGVLAVGETVRYRKKFVTTIYYKPTS